MRARGGVPTVGRTTARAKIFARFRPAVAEQSREQSRQEGGREGQWAVKKSSQAMCRGAKHPSRRV